MIRTHYPRALGQLSDHKTVEKNAHRVQKLDLDVRIWKKKKEKIDFETFFLQNASDSFFCRRLSAEDGTIRFWREKILNLIHRRFNLVLKVGLGMLNFKYQRETSDTHCLSTRAKVVIGAGFG